MDLSLREIATTSIDDLILKHKLSRAEIQAAIMPEQPKPIPVPELLPRALSTGVPKLDRVLGGGIFTRRITEITGPAAAGKTLLCLSLALGAQACDPRKVCFLASEQSLIFRRLDQLKMEIPASVDKIITVSKAISTAEALKAKIHSDELRTLATTGRISVLIIDTLHWLETDDLISALTILRKLAVENDIAVVLTNGVVSTPAVEPVEWANGVPQGIYREIPHVMGVRPRGWADHPRMGWGLARNVDTRIQLTRVSATLRRLKVLYSGDVAPRLCFYAITREGLDIRPSPAESLTTTVTPLTGDQTSPPNPAAKSLRS